MTELESLQAENARLREALEAVADGMIVMEAVLRGYGQLPRLTEETQRLKQIIEAALSTPAAVAAVRGVPHAAV